nr:hypothetical protein [Tanacetum cinerariifolium]
MEPLDTLLMGDEVISTILERENDEFMKSGVDDLVPILRESELTLDSTDLYCSMPIDPPLPCINVVGDVIVDIDLLLGEHLDTLSTEDREIDFNPIRDIEELERLLADDPIPVLRVFDEPLVRMPGVSVFKKVEGIPEVKIRLLARSVRTPDVSVIKGLSANNRVIIPSAMSADDMAATWASETESTDVALPRWLTWDLYADVACYNCKISCSFKNSNTVSFYHRSIKQVIFNHTNFSMMTLADKAILSGADNHPPMLEKDILVRNVDSTTKFYMYPSFLQLIIRKQVGDLSTHTTKYTSLTLTQKVFANMRRVVKGFSGIKTPLFEGMLVDQRVMKKEITIHSISYTTYSTTTTTLRYPFNIPGTTNTTTITSGSRIYKFEKEGEETGEEAQDESVEAQKGRMIAEMDQDDVVVLEDDKEEDKEVADAVKDVKEAKVDEKPKPLKKKQQIEQDDQYARELHAEVNKDIDWDEAIDHVKRKVKEDTVVKKYQAIKRKPQTEA